MAKKYCVVPPEFQEAIWFCEAMREIPEVRDVFAYNRNEGKSSQEEGYFLKKCGLRKGLSDYTIYYASGRYNGLLIELKKKNGKPSPEQLDWVCRMRKNGFAAEICYGATHAIQVVKDYVNLSTLYGHRDNGNFKDNDRTLSPASISKMGGPQLDMFSSHA